MDAAALAVLLSMFVMVSLRWSVLPERIPTHYNTAGEPNKWSPKGGALILPVVGAGLFILLTALSGLKGTLNTPAGVALPPYADTPEARAEIKQTLGAVKLAVMIGFAYITWRQVGTPEQGLGRMFVPVFLAVTIGASALFCIRMRRHRTPNS
jgi:uncharacterized membrane protein